jgi:hypothetical protein
MDETLAGMDMLDFLADAWEERQAVLCELESDEFDAQLDSGEDGMYEPFAEEYEPSPYDGTYSEE